MKAVEDISESLNSLSQVISMSFSFAKSSPMKAKHSLARCAEYLQSKTFASTSFLLRFWMVLIDLLKSEHVEALVLTVLQMLQSLIALLKTKEVQRIVTDLLKLAASEPVGKLVVGVTKCAKSLFYILKTDEIAQFQEQIWALIEDETAAQMNRDTQTKQPGMADDVDVDDENEGDNPTMDMRQKQHTQGASAAKTAGAQSQSYYSQMKAWSGISSMFGAYPAGNEEDEDEEESKEDAPAPRPAQRERVQRSQSMSTMSHMPITSNASARTSVSANRARTASRMHHRAQSEHIDGLRPVPMSVPRRASVASPPSAESQTRSRSSSVCIDDWCCLIHFLDDLEDDGDLSIDEGDKLRRLAMEQKMSLLIVFKCYRLKQSRFLRYAREIMRDAQQEPKCRERERVAMSSGVSPSNDEKACDELEVGSDGRIKGDGVGDIVCID